MVDIGANKQYTLGNSAAPQTLPRVGAVLFEDMAQKRMIDKKISVSEQVANLPIEAQLIFTWSICHADDIGLLPFSHRTLKATIIPMIDMTLETFGNHMESIVKQGLYEVFEYEKEKYYRVVKFAKHQTLKKDRQPQVLIKIRFFKDPEKTWRTMKEMLETFGFQSEDNDFHLGTEVKRSEEKIVEDKRNNAGEQVRPTPFYKTNKDFMKFYEAYPRKTAPKKAYEAWKKAKDKPSLQEMLKIVEKQKGWEQWRAGFIPHPATWLNQGRWDDEVNKGQASGVTKIQGGKIIKT